MTHGGRNLARDVKPDNLILDSSGAPCESSVQAMNPTPMPVDVARPCVGLLRGRASRRSGYLHLADFNCAVQVAPGRALMRRVGTTAYMGPYLPKD